MLNRPIYLDYTEIPFHDSVGLFLQTDLCGWSEGNEVAIRDHDWALVENHKNQKNLRAARTTGTNLR
jgi:hypothetical protein